MDREEEYRYKRQLWKEIMESNIEEECNKFFKEISSNKTQDKLYSKITNIFNDFFNRNYLKIMPVIKVIQDPEDKSKMSVNFYHPVTNKLIHNIEDLM